MPSFIRENASRDTRSTTRTVPSSRASAKRSPHSADVTHLGSSGASGNTSNAFANVRVSQTRAAPSVVTVASASPKKCDVASATSTACAHKRAFAFPVRVSTAHAVPALVVAVTSFACAGRRISSVPPPPETETNVVA